jgi:hypothetical protein
MIGSYSKCESSLHHLIAIKDAYEKTINSKAINSKEDIILVKRKQILEEKIEKCQKKKEDITSNQVEIEKEIQRIAHVAIEESKRNSDERILIVDSIIYEFERKIQEIEITSKFDEFLKKSSRTFSFLKNF